MNSDKTNREKHASLLDFLAVINDEIRSYNEFAKDRPETDFTKRMKVRTIFGCIEADISHLKASALHFTKDPEKTFRKADNLALQDLEERTGKSGEIEQRQARITLKDNVKLALRCFSKTFGISYQINFGSTGGAAFLQAIGIRDRIIHPKSASDWRLSDADMDVVISAWNWFGQELTRASTPPQR